MMIIFHFRPPLARFFISFSLGSLSSKVIWNLLKMKNFNLMRMKKSSTKSLKKKSFISKKLPSSAPSVVAL